jgi:hypothetical protein
MTAGQRVVDNRTTRAVGAGQRRGGSSYRRFFMSAGRKGPSPSRRRRMSRESGVFAAPAAWVFPPAFPACAGEVAR